VKSINLVAFKNIKQFSLALCYLLPNLSILFDFIIIAYLFPKIFWEVTLWFSYINTIRTSEKHCLINLFDLCIFIFFVIFCLAKFVVFFVLVFVFNFLCIFVRQCLNNHICFSPWKDLKTYQEKFLNSMKYVTTSCVSIASQSKGWKWLLIFCNPKIKPRTINTNPTP